MKITIKKVFIWGLGCIKRGLILLIPTLLVTGLLFDILTMANNNYPNNIPVFIFGILGILFYISCLYCILIPFNKVNMSLLIISFCLFFCMFKFNPDIKKIFQHLKCIEVSSVPCPEGIVLGGG